METQRIALLRLLAGWSVVVGILSCKALAGRVPVCVLMFFDSLLSRAERAAWFLAIVSMRGLAARDARRRAGPIPLYAPERKTDFSPDGLLVRLRVLKAMLEDLPGHALRLLRRGVSAGRGLSRFVRDSDGEAHGIDHIILYFQRLAPRATYPPIG